MNDRLIAAVCIILARQLGESNPNKPFAPSSIFTDDELEKAVNVVRTSVGLGGPR